MSMKALLLSMPQTELNELPYGRLMDLRQAAYAEHVAAMEVPADLATWQGVMRSKFGPTVKVHHGTYSNYLTALMVVRYGEAIEHWPDAFSKADVMRAVLWQVGKFPNGVRHGEQSERGLMLACYVAVMAAAAIVLAILSAPAEAYLGVPILGSAMTNYLENQLADHLFRTATFSKPSVLAVALYTAAPGETGGGTEVTGGSYARVSNNPADANWNGTHGTTSGASSGTGGVVSNAGILTFPTPSANWGVVTHAALHDATSGGNMLSYLTLTAAKTINNGDPAPTFAAAALTFTWA